MIQRLSVSRQQIGNPNSANGGPVDYNRDFARQLDDFTMPISNRFHRATRLGINLDPAIDQVDNPVNRHPSRRVNPRLGLAILLEARARHLDHECDVCRLWIAVEIIPRNRR